jgi:hypothetical protein
VVNLLKVLGRRSASDPAAYAQVLASHSRAPKRPTASENPVPR